VDVRFAFEVGCTLCLQITVLIAVTFALQRWVSDAQSGCRLWTSCFVCVIGLVAAALVLPHRRFFDFPVELSREGMLAVVVWQGRIAIVLAVVWAAGVAILLVKQAILCVSLIQFLRRKCEAVDADSLLARVQFIEAFEPSSTGSDDPATCVASLQNLAIFSSNQIAGPFCWQLHRPVVVLPKFLLDEDDATLRHVLLHEFEHIRTHHPMQHFLQGVCSILFWFHPLVWLAARGAELAREFLCDELAAKTIGKFGVYLSTLAKVAQWCGNASCTGVPKGTLAFGNQKSALIRRSNRLVKLADGEVGSSRVRPTVAMFALLSCALLIQQVWIPTNAMASQRSDWSPWPTWTANALHQIDVHVRDFELFEDRVQMHELLNHGK
jgi:beta-lactamase regulating signal transducer with metallopeptidase domain